MVLSCITWVTGYLYSNDHDLHPVETSILRGFMIMIASYFLCRYEGVSLDYKNVPKEMLIRNLVFLGQAYVMAAVQFYLPLGVIHTLGASGFIFVNVF